MKLSSSRPYLDTLLVHTASKSFLEETTHTQDQYKNIRTTTTICSSYNVPL